MCETIGLTKCSGAGLRLGRLRLRGRAVIVEDIGVGRLRRKTVGVESTAKDGDADSVETPIFRARRVLSSLFYSPFSKSRPPIMLGLTTALHKRSAAEIRLRHQHQGRPSEPKRTSHLMGGHAS